MVKAICEAYNVKFIEVLTGFKYIGEQIKFFEQNNSYEFMFGMEESYGCLAGTYARDKDACCAVTLLCEVAAYYKSKNMTLWDGMKELYNKYGAYSEKLSYAVLQGKDGLEKIGKIMEKLRNNTAKSFGEFEIEAMRDYKLGNSVDYVNNTTEKTDLPTSDVLYYEFANDAWCAVRPSGTEPKIKFYIGTKADSIDEAKELCSKLSDALLSIANEEN